MNAHIAQALDSTKTGDVLKYFTLNENIVELNSGVHDNRCLSMDSTDTQCPVQNGTFTKLKLTDESIHITNIDKSSITANVRINIKPTTKFWEPIIPGDIVAGEWGPVRDKFTRWFVGLKASSHLFDAYRVYSQNRKTNCEQSTAIHENAAIRMLKAQEELDCKPGIYTLWDQAKKMSHNVCGVYFSLADLRAAPISGLLLEFDLTLPVDDLLPFAAMKMFPNCVFGNLILELKTAMQQNFVICQCDPSEVVKQFVGRLSRFPNDGTTSHPVTALGHKFKRLITEKPDWWNKIQNAGITNSFTQIGDVFYSSIFAFSGDGSQMLEIKEKSAFILSECTMMYCRSNINGFNVKNEIVNELYSRYKNDANALIIPTQYIHNVTFSQGPRSSGLSCNGNTPMTNISALMFLFPRTPGELTCCRNPILSSLQCLIDNRPYPDKPFASVEQAHAIFNITNAGLDGLFSPNREFAYSLTFNELGIDKNDTVTYYGPEQDNTSYCFLCSTERLSGYGTFCDGVTKENAQVTLNGTMHSFIDLHPYLTHPITKEVNDCHPIMLLCQDSFWRCSAEKGCVFMCNDKNAVKQITGAD